MWHPELKRERYGLRAFHLYSDNFIEIIFDSGVQLKDKVCLLCSPVDLPDPRGRDSCDSKTCLSGAFVHGGTSFIMNNVFYGGSHPEYSGGTTR